MATKEQLLKKKELLLKRKELLARKASLESKRAKPKEDREFATPGAGFGSAAKQASEQFPGIPPLTLPDVGDITPAEIARRIPETIGPSAGAAFEGIKEAITSPVQTGKTIFDILRGGALAAIPGEQGGRREIDPLIAAATGQQAVTESEPEADIRARGFDPLVDMLKGRVSRPGFTLAEDPFGAALDIGGLAAGGSLTVLKLAPTASKAVKIANSIKKAADATNPIVLPLKAIKGGVDLGGKTLGVALQLTTGTAPGTIKRAFRGGPEFRSALRGDTSGSDILSMTRSALDDMRSQRASAYQEKLAQIGRQDVTIDLAPVQRKIDSTLSDFNIKRGKDGSLNFKRSTIADKTEQVRIKEFIEEIETWGSEPGDLSPLGVDTLKRRVDDFFTPSREGTKIKTQIKNEIKKAMNDAVPEYEQMTSGYRKATEELEQIERTLSLRDKKAGDTAIRKLLSVARRNEEFRVNLIKLMEERTGVNIQDLVAGVALSSKKPQSLAGQLAAFSGGGAALANLDPTFLALVAASSPRLVGELVNVLGGPSRALRQFDQADRFGRGTRAATSQPATQALFQAERAQPEPEPETPRNRLQRRLRDLTIAP